MPLKFLLQVIAGALAAPVMWQKLGPDHNERMKQHPVLPSGTFRFKAARYPELRLTVTLLYILIFFKNLQLKQFSKGSLKCLLSWFLQFSIYNS